jgi:hypothetical protein
MLQACKGACSDKAETTLPPSEVKATLLRLKSILHDDKQLIIHHECFLSFGHQPYRKPVDAKTSTRRNHSLLKES